MMDESQALFRLLQQQQDWITVLAFFIMALFWYLAPILGYDQGRRLLILGALGVILAKMGLAASRIGLFHFFELDQIAGSARWGQRSFIDRDSLSGLVLYIFLPPLEATLFVLAMVLFTCWLFTLCRRDQMPGPE